MFKFCFKYFCSCSGAVRIATHKTPAATTTWLSRTHKAMTNSYWCIANWLHWGRSSGRTRHHRAPSRAYKPRILQAGNKSIPASFGPYSRQVQKLPQTTAHTSTPWTRGSGNRYSRQSERLSVSRDSLTVNSCTQLVVRCLLGMLGTEARMLHLSGRVDRAPWHTSSSKKASRSHTVSQRPSSNLSSALVPTAVVSFTFWLGCQRQAYVWAPFRLVVYR